MIKETQYIKKERINIKYEEFNESSQKQHLSKEEYNLDFDLSSSKFSSLKKSIKSLDIYNSIVKIKTLEKEPGHMSLYDYVDLEDLNGLVSNQIDQIENFVKNNSPLSKILNDIEQLKNTKNNKNLKNMKNLQTILKSEPNTDLYELLLYLQ
jgi:hypothetical protein